MKNSNHGIDLIEYEFEGFRIDAAKRLLFRADNEAVPLTPKVFDTLLFMVEHPDQVLDKDFLLSQIWPDSIVEENNLTQNISALRKALGERPHEHRFIVTVPGRGYKFVGHPRRTSNGLSYGLSERDNAPHKAADHNRRFDVEKQGNVLAVVDWIEPPIKAESNYPAVKIAEAPVIKDSWAKPWHVVLGALAVVSLLSVFALWKLGGGRSGADAGNERTYTYLTDGIEIHNPAISPDGKYFVYNTFDGEFTHTWLQQVGQSTRTEVLPPTMKTIGEKTFSPDGQFVYFLAHDDNDRTMSLYKMPAFGKVFTKVLDDVHTPVSFSPDGTEMTFSRYNAETKESWIIIANADGTGQRTLVRGSKDRYVYYPSWSPSGRSIAFGDVAVNDGSGTAVCRLAAVDAAGGDTVSLSDEKWANCYRMAWTSSAGGIIFVGTRLGEDLSTRRNQVWYVALADGKPTRISNEGYWHELSGVTGDDAVLVYSYDRAAQVWAMNADGDSASAVQLTSGRSDGRAGLVPMPDGRIAYIARNDDRLELWAANADGSQQTLISNEPPQIEELRATPDGKYFIFLSRVGHTNQIFRLDADGSNLRQLTAETETVAGDASISPDSRSIVYGAQKVGGGAWLQRVSIDGGQVTAITGTEFTPQTPHFSPDGSLLSFVTAGNKMGLVPAGGGSPLKFFDTVKGPRINVGARWAPDGRSLAYIAHRNSVSNIWLQPINGDPPRPLTNFTSGEIYNFAFSHDGSRLFLSRGYRFNHAVLIRNFVQ